jgi:SSS family solute:Na+ symporter
MVDLLIVGGYLAFMLGVGWKARKASADAYWVADRRYGTGSVAASLVATIFGASSTVGIIGLGYSRGLTGAWWALVGGLALVPFAFFLASRVRTLEVYTLPDILRKAYGRRVEMAGGVVIAIAWCGVVAAQIVAGAHLLGGVFSLPFRLALSVVAVVFVLYTLWGGQLSVIRTDAWQIVLFVGGLVASLLLVLTAGARGAGVLSGVPTDFLSFPVSSQFGWYHLLVFYPLIVGMPYLVGPDIYSRVLCARDGPTARRASILAAVGVVPLSFLLALLGLMIFVQFPGIPPESALPHAVTTLAPVGLKGLIVVGVLGAVMSSADTTLISASTVLSLNVVSPLAGLARRAELRLTRVLVVGMGIGAWGIAAFQEGIIASLLMAFTVFVGGVAVPTLATFWKDRLGVNATGAFWAVVLGGVVAVMGEFREGAVLDGVLGSGGTNLLGTVLGPDYGSILPVLLSAVVLFGLSWLSDGESGPGPAGTARVENRADVGATGDPTQVG